LRRIRIIIVDDESYARDELRHILSALKDVEIVGEAKNGLEVLKLVEDKKPDIVFLDIEMPGLDGMQVAKKLADKKLCPHIIFATAYNQYAVQAFEINAIDYILKPFDEERIKQGISKVKKVIESVDEKKIEKLKKLENLEKLLETISKEKSAYPVKISVKSKGSTTLVDVARIIYARSEGGLVFICEDGKEHLTDYASLDRLESEVDPAMFHRTHRSYLVNLEKMKQIVPLGGGHYIVRCVSTGDQLIDIPLSRRQARGLREKVKF